MNIISPHYAVSDCGRAGVHVIPSFHRCLMFDIYTSCYKVPTEFMHTYTMCLFVYTPWDIV